ncbi:MAG TPA: trehalase family glycosidase [Acidobacteriaceae bacterium]|nr:trehalase family glycosidase [Acidobacteriaceae bacterium]
MRPPIPSFRTLISTLLLSSALAAPGGAQTGAALSPPAAQAAGPDILAYIRGGWDTLSRSMAECKSLVDPKVLNEPVLYLPAGMNTPPALELLKGQCRVRVEHLPRAVHQLGDIRPAELKDEGLLYLPNRYVVPGGRFNEMYGWDSYFIVLGLLHDNRDDLARGMVDNFFFEIENYGALLNANRTYFLTRSQPPLLSSMIREVYEHPGAAPALDKAWLAHAYAMAVRDHALWTSDIHRAGNTGLARYFDIGAGPVPEMADDSTYYPDVIRWLLAHPDSGADYLLPAPEQPTPAEQAELARTSCDMKASRVCAHAFASGHRLTAAYFQGDRAMRESGFDTSFRFGPFSGSTENYAPVCLNSLLFKYEGDLAHFATLLGKPDEAARWTAAAEARRAAMDKYLWNEQTGFFFDYDTATGKQSTYRYLSGFYPLWAGLASPAQAKRLEGHLHDFEHEGGLAMSTEASGTQWDLPYGWAPTNWLTVQGLERYGDRADAVRIAREFSATVLDNFKRDGTIREKYNVVSGSANIAVAAGYKANVIGFGWTNGVYLRMQDLLDGRSAQRASPPGVSQ